MRVIRVTAKAGPDGHFHLKLPLGTGDTRLYDVAVIISERPPEQPTPTPEALGYPAGQLQAVLGSIDDDTFVEPPDMPPPPAVRLELD